VCRQIRQNFSLKVVGAHSFMGQTDTNLDKNGYKAERNYDLEKEIKIEKISKRL